MVVVAGAGAGASIDAPLVPRSAQGKFLSCVLMKKRPLFHFAVADLLKQLAEDKEAALSRMFLSSGSDEASLHRFFFFNLPPQSYDSTMNTHTHQSA